MQQLEIRISAWDKKGRNRLQAKTVIVSDLPKVKPCLLTTSQLLPNKIKQNPSPKLLPESCNYLENRIFCSTEAHHRQESLYLHSWSV